MSNICNWLFHFQRVTNRAWSRTLKIKANRQALEKNNFAPIRPLLEYSNSVWDNCSNELKRQIDSVNYEADSVGLK